MGIGTQRRKVGDGSPLAYRMVTLQCYTRVQRVIRCWKGFFLPAELGLADEEFFVEREGSLLRDFPLLLRLPLEDDPLAVAGAAAAPFVSGAAAGAGGAGLGGGCDRADDEGPLERVPFDPEVTSPLPLTSFGTTLTPTGFETGKDPMSTLRPSRFTTSSPTLTSALAR